MITASEIRQARKTAGLSQAKLAELVGVSQRTVGGWERGESSPGIAESRLLDALGPHMRVAGKGSPLQGVTDAQLLAEIAARFARSFKEEGQAHGNAAQKRLEEVDGQEIQVRAIQPDDS